MDGFTFYQSYYKAAALIPDERQRLAFLWAVIEYALNDNEVDLQAQPFAAVAFEAVKPNLDKSKKRGATKKENQKSNLISKKKNQKSNLISKKSDTDTVTVTDTVTDTVIDKGAKRPRFKPPTRDEVQAYCNERNSTVNADKFVNYYTSKGWLVGKAPMKDWKAAVRAWEVNDKERVDKNKFNQGVESHDYKWDDLERELLGVT